MLIEVGGVLVCPSGAEYEVRNFEQNIAPNMRRAVTASGYAVGLNSGYRAEFIVMDDNRFFITHFVGSGSLGSRDGPVKYLSPFEYKLLKTTEDIACK